MAVRWNVEFSDTAMNAFPGELRENSMVLCLPYDAEDGSAPN